MRNTGNIIKLAIKALIDELEANKIYLCLAQRYRHNKELYERFISLAEMEAKHIAFWQKFLEKRGIDTSTITFNESKVKLFLILTRILGLGLTLKLLENSENEAIGFYANLLELPDLSSDEKEQLSGIIADEVLHEEELIDLGGRLKEFMNHIRDAVLGMSDGLVEVLSVAAGLAGAYGSPLPVALGGGIVGIAGALSMAIGSFNSVRAQRQVRENIISRMRLIAEYVPNILVDRVKKLFLKKGFTEKTSEEVAIEASRNKKLLADLVISEEYGLKEEVLENPVKAGIYTGVFYLIGAFVPLLPYFLGVQVVWALPISFIIAGAMLSITGFVIALLGNLDIKKKMVELIIGGLGSATLTFIIGKLASLLLGIEVT